MSRSPPSKKGELESSPDEACGASLGDARGRRCTLPRGHDGLHRWRAPDGSDRFEWG